MKLVDFGIAKLIGPAEDIFPADSKRPQMGKAGADGNQIGGRLESVGKSSPSESALTAATAALGTPSYMAPEQRDRPAEVDHRADIYSLGVVFYEMLTGELPVGKFAPPSAKSASDPRVDEVVLRALEQQREHRQQSAGEIKTQVETITASPNVSRRAETQTSPAPTPLLKTANAYLSTPEWLASARGRFWVYSGKGTLVLTRDQLAFTDDKTGATTSIPLAAIRDVSLGNYPWLAKPAPLHYLSITWVENGLTRCRYFTPNRSWLCPVWETNPIVLEWHQALRAAVTTATGKAPAETPAPPHRPTVGDFAWMGLLFGLPMLLINVVLFNFTRVVAPVAPLPPATEFIPSLICLEVVVPFLTLYLLPRWGRQRAGSPPPLTPLKPSLWPTLALAAFGAPLLVHLMLRATGQVPPEPAHEVGRLVFSFPGTLVLAGMAGVGLWLRHRRETPSAATPVAPPDLALGSVWPLSWLAFIPVAIGTGLMLMLARQSGGSDNSGFNSSLPFFGTFASLLVVAALFIWFMLWLAKSSSRHSALLVRLMPVLWLGLAGLTFHDSSRGNGVMWLGFALSGWWTRERLGTSVGAKCLLGAGYVIITGGLGLMLGKSYLPEAWQTWSRTPADTSLAAVLTTLAVLGTVAVVGWLTPLFFGFSPRDAGKREQFPTSFLKYPGLLLLLLPGLLFVILLIQFYPQLESSDGDEHRALPQAGPPIPTAIPPHIEFKVLRVENPPGTWDILLHFERDQNPALGLEVWQDMTPSAGLREQPHRGTYRTWQVKTWAGVNDHVLGWTLPLDFTEAETRAVAKDMEQRAKSWRQLPDGALLEFATVTHGDGWKYHLLATVKRAPGAVPPGPPAPTSPR